MARYESQSMQVHPDNEQMMIRKMERFGWELKSTQEVNTKDSHLESYGDTIYSITESERYIKLMFQRDVESPNYSIWKQGEGIYTEIEELRESSRSYDFSYSIWPDFYSNWFNILVGVLVFLFGSFLGMTFSSINYFLCMLISAVIICGGIILFRLIVLRPKAKADHIKFEEMRAKDRELLALKEAELRELGL